MEDYPKVFNKFSKSFSESREICSIKIFTFHNFFFFSLSFLSLFNSHRTETKKLPIPRSFECRMMKIWDEDGKFSRRGGAQHWTETFAASLSENIENIAMHLKVLPLMFQCYASMFQCFDSLWERFDFSLSLTRFRLSSLSF